MPPAASLPPPTAELVLPLPCRDRHQTKQRPAMGSKACVSRLQKEYKAILKASSGAWGMRQPAALRLTSDVVADVVARALSPHHCAGASATDYRAPGSQQPAGVALVSCWGRKLWPVVCYCGGCSE